MWLESFDHMAPSCEFLPRVSCLGVTESSELCGALTTQMWLGCFGSRYPPPLMRYTERVITRTSLSRSASASAGLAGAAADLSSGFAAGASFLRNLAKSSGDVSLLKAISLPSGDHTGLPAPRGRSVNFQDSPPFMGSI